MLLKKEVDLYLVYSWLKFYFTEGTQLPMTGAIDEFETISENPLTFSDLMNVLRDAATFVDDRLKNIYATRGFFETERSDDESILNEGEGEPETKRNNAITNSLEEKLHQVVQYLIYFRNTDGSFGEPMVEQSIR